jgi:hypothetical protein
MVVIASFFPKMFDDILDTKLDAASIALCLTLHAGCFTPLQSAKNLSIASEFVQSESGTSPTSSKNAEAKHSNDFAISKGGGELPPFS